MVQTGSVPLVLRRGNKYQFICVLMGRTQGRRAELDAGGKGRIAAVAIGSHRSGSGTAPRWGLGLPKSTDQSRSNRRENEACVRRAAVAGGGGG